MTIEKLRSESRGPQTSRGGSESTCTHPSMQ